MAGLEAVVWALKQLTGRTAPASGVNAGVAGGSSFPSGHAAAATFCLLLSVALLCRSRSGRLRPRWPWAVGLAGAATVGVCTVGLGYHGPQMQSAAGWWGRCQLASRRADCSRSRSVPRLRRASEGPRRPGCARVTTRGTRGDRMIALRHGNLSEPNRGPGPEPTHIVAVLLGLLP